MTIKYIEPWVLNFLKTQNLVALRRKKDNLLLNVSYTEDGLKWTAAKNGTLVYYKRGYVSQGKIITDEVISDEVYVSPFVPMNHRTEFLQSYEAFWTKKALKLLVPQRSV